MFIDRGAITEMITKSFIQLGIMAIVFAFAISLIIAVVTAVKNKKFIATDDKSDDNSETITIEK